MLNNHDEHAAIAAMDPQWHLLYSGMLSPGCGIYDVLIAVRLARARGVCARLSIAGRGPDYLLVRRFVRILGLDGEVSFVEPQRPGVSAMPAHHDLLLVRASPHGLPGVLLDAMRSGIPAIATRTAATAALIEHGVNGLLLDEWSGAAIAAAIASIAAAPGVHAAMSAACLSRRRTAPPGHGAAGPLGSSIPP